MKPKHPIDELFRQQLTLHEVEVSPHLWHGVQARQAALAAAAARRRRRRILALALPTAAALAAVVWLWPATYADTPLGSFPIYAAASAGAPTAQPQEQVRPAAASTREAAEAALPAPDRPQALRTSASTQEPSAPVFFEEEASHPTPEAEAALVVEQAAMPSTWHSPRMPALSTASLGTVSRIRRPGDPVCANFTPLRWDLQIAALGGPMWAVRQLSPIDPEYAGYAQHRMDSEQPAMGFSTGLRIGAVATNGVAFHTGLQYTVIREHFGFVNENEERILINTVRDSDGNIIRTDTTRWVGTREKITQNRYRLLDVPLLAGYQWSGKKLKWAAHAGVLFNVSLRARGDFLSPADLQPVSFTQGQPEAFPAFHERIGIGGYAGLSVGYPLNAHTDLFLEAGASYNPSTLSREAAKVHQRYALTGLQVGLRKKI